jgi:hypothetical protein
VTSHTKLLSALRRPIVHFPVPIGTAGDQSDGTINGATDRNDQNYKFMMWAGDGSPDTVRIKIWWEDAAREHFVYDNGA